MIIVHITNQKTWDSALEKEIYQADTLESQGFIHCCQPDQVNGVLENWFQGVDHLMLLEIDTDKIAAKIVYENLEGGEELFPHIYGAINLDAVIGTKTT